MTAYIEGDLAACEALFRRHGRAIMLMLRDRGATEEEAQDVVQQTFLQLHRARVRFQPGRRFWPWLITIAFNLWRDELRRARRWRETPLVGEVAVEPVHDHDGAERRSRVRVALRKLNAKQRSIIEMHWFDELSYPQIAARVGATPGAVKLRAFRAHAALRQALAA